MERKIPMAYEYIYVFSYDWTNSVANLIITLYT